MQLEEYETNGRGDALLQSLFCWKFVCNPRLVYPGGPDHRVAVLVLLEVRMQLVGGSIENAMPTLLQSLFCWKFVCNQVIEGEYKNRVLFALQSLFCWKFVCNMTS